MSMAKKPHAGAGTFVDNGGSRMRTSMVFALGCLVVTACSETPTANANSSLFPAIAWFDRGGSAGGADFLSVSETGVDALLPDGFCSFRPDGSGEFNNFLRTAVSGTRTLKIQDASGTVIISPFGAPEWRGTGRVNVSWPNYPSDQTFEMMMVGDHDAVGNAATCKYRIANGNLVEWFVKTK